MKVKVSEASGPVLDWMVAKCEGGYDLQLRSTYGAKKAWQYTVRDEEDNLRADTFYLSDTAYSTDWVLGGPIIEREEIELHVLPSFLALDMHPTYTDGDRWEANIWPTDEDCITICGPTPLIAAMRCYVASKLGKEAARVQENERCVQACAAKSKEYLARSNRDQHSYGAGLGAAICAELPSALLGKEAT